jgi:hypothetical protein
MTRSLLTPKQEAHFLGNVLVADSGCWKWTKALSPDGYPVTGQKVSGRRLTGSACRLAFMHWIGPIPDGYQLDHTCHSRAVADGSCKGGKGCPHRKCVNPAHLEPVTPTENARRTARAMKEWCPQGHPYDEENTYIEPGGGRACRACARARAREQAMRKKGAPLLPPPGERTHCPYGHPYDEENTFPARGGSRGCRACRAARSRASKARQRIAAAEGRLVITPRQPDLTHCPKEHTYDEENTYLYHGARCCRACARVKQRAYRERLKQRRAA